MCQHHHKQVLHTLVQSLCLLLKVLVQYVVTLPEKRAATCTRVIGARVLMSAEGYHILHEKKEKEAEGRGGKKKVRKI